MLIRRIAAALVVAAMPAVIARAVPQSSPASGAPFPASAPAGDGATAPGPTTETLPAIPRSGVFRFDELGFDLGFEAEWRRRRTESENRGVRRGRRGQTDSLLRLEETLGAYGAGNLIDERFATFQFDVRGGFWQERWHESRLGPDLSSSPTGGRLEYDARLNILPAGKLSGTAFAFQLDDRVPRLFLPSLDRQRERYGAELLWNDAVLPMRLAFESEYEELRGRGRPELDDERRGNRRLEYELTWQPSEWHQFHLQYEYEDRRERYSGNAAEFDTTRNYLTLTDTLHFGADQRSRLELLGRFQDETGDTARDVWELAPQLRFQHSEDVATYVRGQMLRESFEGLDARRLRGEAGATYRPLEWLDTGVNVYALTDQNEQGSDVNSWGANLNVDAQRENAWGRLGAHLSYTHADQRADDPGDTGIVLDEAATFRDPLPVFLNQLDVRPLSIVVMDAARRRVFLVGRDFLVGRIGRTTTLTRVRTGRIADGQTVSVSYAYRIAEGFETRRDRLDVRIQQAFKSGWTPYYAATLQDEDIDRSRYVPYAARDILRQRVGVDFRQPRWSIGGELEFNDDSIDPYRAAHVRGDWTILQKAPHTLSFRGNGSFFAFDGTRDLSAHDALLLDAGLNYRWLLGENVEANVAAAYRFENDSRSGPVHGVDLSGGLNWRIGLFTLSVELEYDQLDQPGSDDGTFAAWIKLRRDFPMIGGPRR